MATVRFSINLREDAWNWVRVGQQKRAQYGRKLSDIIGDIPKDILSKIRRSSRSKAIRIVLHHLRGKRELFLDDLRAVKALHEEHHRKYGAAMLNAVAMLTQRPLYASTFFATFTLMGSCPYNPSRRWFMISAKASMPKQLNTICHEILHLQFIHYYHKTCRDGGLNEKQFQDLKEALTVLLNEPQFRRFHTGRDVGYSDHTRLRKIILRLWRKKGKKSFKSFLDSALKATKKEFPVR